MKLKIYTDGGSRNNPGPGGIGILVCDAEDNEILRHKDYIGEATNNIAEYCALIAGLEIAFEIKADEVVCHLDSELVVKQMKGEYQVKHPQMKKLNFEVQNQLRKFNSVSFIHLRREHPKMKIADALVNEALDAELCS